MSLLEEDVVLVGTTEEGNAKVALPYTRVNNVEGIGRSANTAYAVGDIVYVDNNKKVALKCTTAGTTSSGELDVSSKAIGETVADGSVVWEMISRSEFAGSTSTTNGASGLVPAPAMGGENAVLRGDGEWHKDSNVKTFTSLEQLGLDNNTTIKNIAFALPQGSLLCLVANVVDFPNMALPSIVNSGMLTVINNNPYGNYVQFLWQQDDGILWSGSFSGYKPDAFTWYKLATNGALSMPSSGRYTYPQLSNVGDTFIAPCDGWLKFNIIPGSTSGLIALDTTLGHYYVPTVPASVNGNSETRWLPMAKGQTVTVHQYTSVAKLQGIAFIYAQSEG